MGLVPGGFLPPIPLSMFYLWKKSLFFLRCTSTINGNYNMVALQLWLQPMTHDWILFFTRAWEDISVPRLLSGQRWALFTVSPQCDWYNLHSSCPVATCEWHVGNWRGLLFRRWVLSGVTEDIWRLDDAVEEGPVAFVCVTVSGPLWRPPS